MPDWLIWVAAVWLIFGCGAGCRRAVSRRRLGAGRGRAGRDAVGSGRADSATVGAIPAGSPSAGAVGATGAVAAAGASGVAAQPETALQSLQRRFVDGAITLEQYEAELDRLDRKELE